nr:hypothetical protein GCM10025732_23010 [Glycomyces mayteni]
MSTEFTPVRVVAGDGRASEIEDLLRADLRGQSPYGAPQLDVPVQLNTNENAFAIPEDVAAVVAEFIGRELRGLNRYPDRDALALRADLAAYLGHGLTADHVWAANGSNEILQQLLQAFGGPGRTVLGFMPSYSMHPLLARGTGTAFVDAGREDGYTLSPAYVRAAIEEHDPDLVFLVSPNNPTGTALDAEVVEAAYAAARGIVVIDEAYAEFARDPASTALGRLEGASAWSSPGRSRRRSRSPGPASATSPPTPNSWRSSCWCACRTTCRASRRLPPAERSRAPRSSRPKWTS